MFRGSALARLLSVYLPFITANMLGGSLIYLYFKDAGVGDADLLLSFMFLWAAPLPLILAFNNRKTSSRMMMWAGLGAGLAAYAITGLMPPVREVLFACSFLIGTTYFLFWVPFNTLYFSISHGKEASLGTVYFSSGSLLSLALPLIAAAIAQGLGFSALFLASAALYFIPMMTAMRLADSRSAYRIKACIRELRGFKTLIFIEGLHGGAFAAVSVISLYYFTKPLDMGLFLSFTTMFAVLAAILVSRLSDRTRRRFEYIKMFGPAFGLVTLLASLATSAAAWYGAISARNFFAALFWPFTTAMIVDNKRDIAKSMVSREYVLSVGRVTGVAVALLCAVFLNLYASLAILGVCVMAYPLVIDSKRRRIKVE